MHKDPDRVFTVVGLLSLLWLLWRFLSLSAWVEAATLSVLALIVARILVRLREARFQASESGRVAMIDSLTGFYVRDFLLARLAEEDDRSRRYGGCFALLMIDLDGFKAINDHNGHLAGDHYLREVGLTIREQLRAADIPCRYGGDEFCILLPQTGLAGSRAIAERIRSAVAEQIVDVENRKLRTTVSIGFAVFPQHGTGDLRKLMGMADQALYRAKRAGRDRVVPFAA